MLATTPYMFSARYSFLPKIPSPLSPRSANIYGRPSFASMSDAEKEKTAQEVPYSQRPVKKAPSPRPDELKERRRKLFLKQVADSREDKRFEARGEDIMRLDFVQQQKQWEEKLAREAPRLSFDPVDEETEQVNQKREGEDQFRSSSDAMILSTPSTQQPWLEDAADEAMLRENAELEALLTYMPGDDQTEVDENKLDHSEHLYSDDDDYDALFSELMEQGEPPSLTARSALQQQGEAMDMS